MPPAAPPRPEVGVEPRTLQRRDVRRWVLAAPVPSWYASTWWLLTSLVAVGLATVAVVESPWKPLLFVTFAPALLAGVLGWSNEDQDAVRWSWVTFEGLGAALAAADLAGAGHHVQYALAIVAVLAASAPWTMLWVAGVPQPGCPAKTWRDGGVATQRNR